MLDPKTNVRNQTSIIFWDRTFNLHGMNHQWLIS
jgi:hypothetical protein